MAGILIKLSYILFGISGVCFLVTAVFFVVFKIPKLHERKLYSGDSKNMEQNNRQVGSLIKNAKTEESECWEDACKAVCDMDKEMIVEC